jgi:hypothetical protein
MPTAGPTPAQTAALPPCALAAITTIADDQGLTTARMSARRSAVAARWGTAQATALSTWQALAAGGHGDPRDDKRFQNENGTEAARTADRRLPLNPTAQDAPATPKLRSGDVP